MRNNPLRAFVWTGLLTWTALVWIVILAHIIVPAARAVVEAASGGPARCASVAASDRTACVSGGW